MIEVSKTNLSEKKFLVKFEEQEKFNLGMLVAEYVAEDFAKKGKEPTSAELDLIAKACAGFSRFLHEKCEVYGHLDLYLANIAVDDDDEEDLVNDDKN